MTWKPQVLPQKHRVTVRPRVRQTLSIQRSSFKKGSDYKSNPYQFRENSRCSWANWIKLCSWSRECDSGLYQIQSLLQTKQTPQNWESAIIYVSQPKASQRYFPSEIKSQEIIYLFTEFHSAPSHIVEKDLSHNIFAVPVVGTTEKQVLNRLKLRSFLATEPRPDMQTTLQDWECKADVIKTIINCTPENESLSNEILILMMISMNPTSLTHNNHQSDVTQRIPKLIAYQALKENVPQGYSLKNGIYERTHTDHDASPWMRNGSGITLIPATPISM